MIFLLKNKWVVKNNSFFDESSSLLDSILSARGLNSEEEKKRMLSPGFDMVNDPFLFEDMRKACDSIVCAIDKKHKIVIYGDYDADGIASTSILYLFLQYLNANVTFLIPDRISEGYGLTDLGVGKILAAEARLVITVDCGISSIIEVQALVDHSIQVVITDHHESKTVIPDATAVIDPKIPDCGYPFKDLAGVGVVLKLIQALCIRLDLGDFWKKYIDIAALGTIADMVPLVNENRMIVFFGLSEMNRFTNAGMKSLIERMDFQSKKITATTISFGIAPRINAAGRMGDSNRSVRLLTSVDNDECIALSDELISDNTKRQEIETLIFNIAKEQITAEYDFTSNEIIVVYKMGWHQGVTGIVATKLVELFNRSVIVFGGDNGFYRGSARASDGISILEAIESASEYVYQFGGHKKAAGLVVHEDKIEDFIKAVKEFSKGLTACDWEEKKIEIYFEIPFEQITLKNAQDIASLAPFGEGNPQPVFLSRNLVVDQIRFLSSGKHMKLSLAKTSASEMISTCTSKSEMNSKCTSNERVDAIAFGFAEKNSSISAGDVVDIIYSIDINEWNGKASVQIVIKDIRKSQEYRESHEPDKYDSALQKSDFAAVYKFLKSNYSFEDVLCDLDVLAGIISNRSGTKINIFKLERIFDIFKEVGLMSVLDCGRHRNKFRLTDIKTNVSLSDSKTYSQIFTECAIL